MQARAQEPMLRSPAAAHTLLSLTLLPSSAAHTHTRTTAGAARSPSPPSPALLPAGRRPVLPAHQELDGDGGGPTHARPAACGGGCVGWAWSMHWVRAGGSARPHPAHTHTHARYPPSRPSTSMKASPPPAADSRLRVEGAAATTAAGFCCSSPAAAAVCTRRLPLQPLLMVLGAGQLEGA